MAMTWCPCRAIRRWRDSLPDLLAEERIDAIVERTRKGGAEIVNLFEDRLGLLRSIRSRSRNGRSHPQRQRKNPALRCLSRRRVWDQRTLCRRARELGAKGVEEIHPDQADGRRERRATKVFGVSSRACDCTWTLSSKHGDYRQSHVETFDDAVGGGPSATADVLVCPKYSQERESCPSGAGQNALRGRAQRPRTVRRSGLS